MRYVKYVVAVLALIAGAAYVCWPTWTTARIDQSKRTGDRILAVVEAYHADRGCCPVSLDLLVPAYIDRVEPPAAGFSQWDYYVNEDGCGLRFGQGKSHYPGYWRAWPRMNYWQLDD